MSIFSDYIETVGPVFVISLVLAIFTESTVGSVFKNPIWTLCLNFICFSMVSIFLITRSRRKHSKL